MWQRSWVVTRHPSIFFWIGSPGVGNDFPKTGSGKHQKHIMQKVGNKLVEEKKERKDKDIKANL